MLLGINTLLRELQRTTIQLSCKHVYHYTGLGIELESIPESVFIPKCVCDFLCLQTRLVHVLGST